MTRRAPAMGGPSFVFPPLAKSAVLIFIANGAVWALMLALVYASPDTASSIAFYGYLTPPLVTDGYLYQVATYMFFHDLQSPFHILFNMLLVYFFAAPLEQTWGVRRTLWFTFGSGLAGGVMVMLFHLIGVLTGLGAGASTIGFSGAAIGMLAAFCVLNAESSILLFFVIPIKAKHILPLTVGIDFLMWVTPSSDVSFPAHLGGIVFALILLRGWGMPERLWLRLRYWKIRRELAQRGDHDKVVRGPWIH